MNFCALCGHSIVEPGKVNPAASDPPSTREMYEAIARNVPDSAKWLIDNLIYWRGECDALRGGADAKRWRERAAAYSRKLRNVRRAAREYMRAIEFRVAEEKAEAARSEK